MRKLPPLNALKAFEAAARHVSFTKAAVELHVTHGAVSRQVSLLEEWLGTPLFQRGASQIGLTDSGRAYAQEVTSLLDRLSVVTAQAMEKAASSAISVSAPPTFTMRWLIPRLSVYQRKRPGIEVRLTTSIAPVHFQENNYDIAIRGALEPMIGCESVPFMTEIIVPVCHADIVESGGLRSPVDLARQTLIRYTTEPYTWSTWFDAAGIAETAGAGTLHFEQMYFALQAAAEGLGVVLVPLFLVADDIVTGKLCAPFGLHGAMHRHYYANTSPASKHNPAIAEFRAWLIEEGRSTEKAINTWAQETMNQITPPESRQEQM
ncbi:LysR family transcriptional regulator, glycine cleavage system transcriptional activator [Variovorax sp. HW608]|uniref:transcriptional regulator GcvA n=1 Tax=Variovorax sp. HW608 TaxID=1034889 RepID=UPI00081FA97A|nr:transcriptional regulator GcvA [Variovorax sp. HW608]SCK43060.1 LysR family transcriptional regulator, glycine cleavage system transcriptional activator [Variovorax sp. HW608]